MTGTQATTDQHRVFALQPAALARLVLSSCRRLSVDVVEDIKASPARKAGEVAVILIRKCFVTTELNRQSVVAIEIMRDFTVTVFVRGR